MAEKFVETPVAVTQRKLPSALVDRQTQDMISRAVLAERERCINVLRSEMSRWERQGGVGVGWSWPKWRDQMLAALRAL